ncbi:hypothetical protein Tco_0858921 [Tanacetum coccineum]|uniref:Reverse transcriptase domain-containing protein n=1 Tax=Tanacetum coccineum TaxID=301880 RepID=A0ABQ5BEI3_9ASTR
MADHLRPMEELLRIPIVAGGNLMTMNTQKAFTIIENKAKVQTCRNKPQVLSSGGTSTQIDAITALTKQLMQNQMGQMADAFQERALDVLPSNTKTNSLAELKPSIPCPSRLQNDKFQALEIPTGRVDHFVYRIDIVDSMCDKFPIENNSLIGNPTPSSDSLVESLSPLLTPFGDSDSLLEETDTLFSHYDDSLPDYEIVCFDTEEKISGSTTSQSDHSLPDYEAFCFDVDHIKEKSSGRTIPHSDLFLLEYESFHFDISIDPLPPFDRSDSHLEEFADELAHIISPSEYDHFYFDLEADLGELPRLLKENISDTSTKGLTIHELNDFPLLLPDRDFIFSEEFSKIDLLVSFSFGNKDKIFDPGIFIIKGVQSKRFHILPLDDFSKISFVSDSLLLTDPSEIKTFLSFPSGNEDKVFDPGILIIDGVFSFTGKSPHNFMINKCHILRFPMILNVTPRQGGNTRRNVMDIITTQWCQQ